MTKQRVIAVVAGGLFLLGAPFAVVANAAKPVSESKPVSSTTTTVEWSDWPPPVYPTGTFTWVPCPSHDPDEPNTCSP